jgi:predicted anti-sigma-YlaC factor YlaD
MRLPRPPWRRARPLNGHDITCEQVVALVTAYLEGELTRDRHALFEAHLDECEDCTEYLRQIRTTIAVTGQLRDEDLDPMARDQLVTLYRRWRSDLDA